MSPQGSQRNSLATSYAKPPKPPGMPSRRFLIFEATVLLFRRLAARLVRIANTRNCWDNKESPDAEVVVPVERIELPTFGLQNRCSTAELNRRIEAIGERRYLAAWGRSSAARIPDLSAKGQNLRVRFCAVKR